MKPRHKGLIEEEARLHAEAQMSEEWDREDKYLIVEFYNHYAEYLLHKLGSLMRAAHDVGYVNAFGVQKPHVGRSWERFQELYLEEKNNNIKK